ncbi:isoleucyl-tRNA synthetase [Fonticula alba]|uniref:isoleucine--tRNA ligase n=1 Tax=Fonticula alba TaxID=691883 RepID=A0A058ZEY7_FONAL|nr:isoleucyl-tRNA synthetase [Fonticula alba]KCV72488.1 isoleucyl-tRNA synthetase [Fonticula alba]|eukprot:XP_009492189.1 isoleucyl-tRNA synthetase [Fonticula alba]
MTFDNVPESISFPKSEEEILAFWKQIDAFQQSLRLSEGRPRYSFYDGPPFATGLPHYGHILAGTIKDVVTRFWALRGYYVERRFGWDCHGLPVEFEIDKKLGIKSPDDVLKMGIANYNAECRSIVMRYSTEWEVTVTRTGRWIDFKNDYKTLNPEFMESVWWVFRQLFDKNLVYRGFKVMPYSMGCHTPLSNFEANQNYKDTVDPAVTVGLRLTTGKFAGHQALAWTTTPWTLPSNLALCVNPALNYVVVTEKKGKTVEGQEPEAPKSYIVAHSCLGSVFGNKLDEYTVGEEFLGEELVGSRYEPLFPYFRETYGDRAFRIVSDSYVKSDSGTGIVHQAPAFGEDDYRVCMEHGVILKGEALPCPIDDTGAFTSAVPEYAGQNVKAADKAIIRALTASGNLFKNVQITHSYPFCWRSDTPLIYRAVPSWFIRVEDLVERLLKNNTDSYWVPEFVQTQRFANWLRDARDWAVSRNRFWGTPLPLWVSEDFEEVVCIGSVEELFELSGVRVTDLHRESIDHITIPSKQGKGDLRRVTEVFDCWFESGSMPYAQQHYPFENKDVFEASFPADFVAEGLDQTRGWFYTLLVISTALFDKPPFKNLIVNGLVLAEDGRKMSKRLANYPDPTKVMDAHGADALRIYLIDSPVVRAEVLRFQERGVQRVVRDLLLPWYNAYRFFVQNADRWSTEAGRPFEHDPSSKTALKLTNLTDRWVLAATHNLISFVTKEMEAYRLYTVVPRLLRHVDQLTNWYVRLNRRRLRGDVLVAEDGSTMPADQEDTLTALRTLFEALFLMTKMMAPFTPFIAEKIYQNLYKCLPTTEEDVRSVHFTSFPVPNPAYFDPEMERAMGSMQRIIELGRVIRERRNVSIKNPLREMIIVDADASEDSPLRADVAMLEEYIRDELNVVRVRFAEPGEFNLNYQASANAARLGRRVGRSMQEIIKSARALPTEDIKKLLAGENITLHGHELTPEDFTLTLRLLSSDESAAEGSVDRESNMDGNIAVLLDLSRDQQLEDIGCARELVNRVQRLRKEAQLSVSDVVHVCLSLEVPAAENAQAAAAAAAAPAAGGKRKKAAPAAGVSAEEMAADREQLVRVLAEQQAFFERTVRSRIITPDQVPEAALPHQIITDVAEIRSTKFVLTFYRAD